MRMLLPARWNKVDLHITGEWGVGANLKNSFSKIRSRFTVPEAGMQDAHLASICCSESLRDDALITPDLLEEELRRSLVGLLAKLCNAKPLCAPAQKYIPGTDRGERCDVEFQGPSVRDPSRAKTR